MVDDAMCNLAFLVPEIVNCGPLNVVLNIIKFLDFDRVSPILISQRKNSDTIYLSEFSLLLNDKIFYLEDYETEKQGLDSIILGNNINVIHSHGYYPDKLLVAIPNVRKISTLHSMFYRDYPKEYGFLKGYIGAFLHFNVLKKNYFDYIVGCSDSVTKYCNKIMNLSNIMTINNGVDQNKFFILSDVEKLENRKSLGFLNEKIFIYAGRFIRRKKVPELIEFFIENAENNATLLLLGDGPEKEKCEKKYASDNIKFIGQVTNPEKYYQIADFVLSNSSAEGYPMSIIEAVSCGCYALLSNISPHKEFIQNNPNSAAFLHEVDFKKFNSNGIIQSTVLNLSAQLMADKYLAIYTN